MLVPTNLFLDRLSCLTAFRAVLYYNFAVFGTKVNFVHLARITNRLSFVPLLGTNNTKLT
jgi:hypothetical protein